MTRSSMGFSDSKTGILSFWVKFTGSDGTSNRVLLDISTDRMFYRLASNAMRATLYNTDGATLALNITSTATITADGNWHHVLLNIDTSTAANCWWAIDGTEGTTINTRTDATIKWSAANWYVSYDSVGLTGNLCELYFAPGQSLGAFSSANVQKFRSTGAKPVDLGSNGSTPTGSQPGIYLHGNSTAFNVNSGTGGNFTLSGTLTNETAP